MQEFKNGEVYIVGVTRVVTRFVWSPGSGR